MLQIFVVSRLSAVQHITSRAYQLWPKGFPLIILHIHITKISDSSHDSALSAKTTVSTASLMNFDFPNKIATILMQVNRFKNMQ